LHAHAERDPQQPGQTAGATAARRRREPPWRGLGRAIAFLTIAPMPASAGRDGLSGAAGWFALVGAAVGAFAGGVRLGAEQLLGRTPATALAMIALVLATGALHEDGLADTADGLGVRGDRARRLAVMRDPATGVFGALALIGWGLLLLTTLAAMDATHALVALTVACALARAAALLHAAATPPARGDGLGAALSVSRPALVAATATSAALSLALCGLADGAIAVGAALLLGASSSSLARRALGGRTGDTLGATVAVVEVLVCVVLLACWRG
jgi:adenosylcobinamide-GDP ribazoletransferase